MNRLPQGLQGRHPQRFGCCLGWSVGWLVGPSPPSPTLTPPQGLTAEVASKADVVYQKMGEWLIQRYKEEMQSTAALLHTIRESIEEENPLPFELRLEGTEFIVDEDMLLFEPETPVKTSKPEGRTADSTELVVNWLTKQQSMQLVSKFRQISPLGCVSRDSFTRLFLQVRCNALVDTRPSGSNLPVNLVPKQTPRMFL